MTLTLTSDLGLHLLHAVEVRERGRRGRGRRFGRHALEQELCELQDSDMDPVLEEQCPESLIKAPQTFLGENGS